MGEVGHDHPLAGALADLRHDGLADEIALSGLSEREVGELIEATSALETPAAFVQSVSRETAGNPFFVQEICSHVGETGASSDAFTLETLGVPEGVKQVIGRRIARLPDGTARLLTIGAVIGRDLDEILRNENLAAAELDRRFAENETAIQHLLRSIQEAVTAGEWRKTEFNVFEILGHVRGELAHSSVLAWLLDPVESHGLGDAFLREFMRKSVGVEPPSVIDIRVVPEFPFHDCRFDIYVKGERWCLACRE